ncbi:hypothetical protein BDK51DRAFT_9647, partial [Blyttiomyces helicus]
KAASQAVLASDTPDGRDPLTMIDPSNHTIPFLFIFAARAKQECGRPGAPGAAILLPQALAFAENFDLQAAHQAPDRIRAFGTAVCNLADRAGSWIAAVKPLLIATRRLATPTGDTLTCLHPMLFKVCFLARTFRPALPILERDISEIDAARYDLTYQDFLLHHYYGALLYLLAKRFDRAMDFLVLCISTPSTVSSAIQIEAYKRFTLVALLVHGAVPPLPKYTPSVVVRAVRHYCVPYNDFAAAHESGNMARVSAELAKHSDLFRGQGLLGLVRQCVESLVRRAIQQLTRTYLTLSLADMARSVDLASAGAAERHVLRMIDEGQVYATVSQSDGGMVSFLDAPAFDPAGDSVAKLEESITLVMQIGDRMQKMDRAVSTSKEYVAKM